MNASPNLVRTEGHVLTRWVITSANVFRDIQGRIVSKVIR